MSQNARLFTAAVLTAVLSACGAKGPLFLPEKPAEEQAATVDPATPETPATDGGAPVEAPIPAEPPVDPATVPASDGNG